ncbi:MAG: hypothetical protein QOH80_1546 [Actinomycetota bacterium]|nr:hypothetical protein [Actinomycetota bacterium]
MTAVVPLPAKSLVLADARGAGRAMRVSWHAEAGTAGLVVLSLWQADHCVGTFRLVAADVPALVESLRVGLAGGDDEDSAYVQASAAP